ncbi:MAG TPA: ABC transporter substrate-binding protein [Candidatus Binataceae bacterium]|jgi:phospholipid transport system substrate-binding protein|nr:ABC transporter substrate-binding protein [Candidatus Binataceae bacterium]
MFGKNFHPSNRVANGKTFRSRVAPFALATTLTALAIAVVAAPAMTATAVSAQAVVKQVIDRALPVLRDKQTPLPNRRRQLRGLLEGHFDFHDMARIALGYHWRELNPSQRAEFVQLFTAFIENAYLSKIQNYAGQEVQVLGQNSEGQGFARVRSLVVQQGKEPIKVDYLLRQVNNDWKIYDVTVDNISIISNYRNQFNRVINDQGYAKLVADMRAKQQQLQASLGS